MQQIINSTVGLVYIFCSYFSGMTFKEKERVTIVPEIMQDPAHKSGNHLFERILREREVGYIRNIDFDKSKDRMEN